jgi:hypothetical protein
MDEELNTTTRTFPRTYAEAFDSKEWWHPHEPPRHDKLYIAVTSIAVCALIFVYFWRGL